MKFHFRPQALRCFAAVCAGIRLCGCLIAAGGSENLCRRKAGRSRHRPQVSNDVSPPEVQEGTEKSSLRTGIIEPPE